MRLLIALGLAALLGACAADIPAKQFWIVKDGGGSYSSYDERAVAYKEEGRVVVVDGVCASACTLLLQAPHCVTDNARVGFHSPYFGIRTPWGVMVNNDDGDKERAAESLSKMIDVMPVAYKEFLKRSKIPSVYEGADKADLLWVEGAEAVKIFGKCKWLK